MSYLISFSSDGNHEVTKCKFLRQTQSPRADDTFISSIAASFYPPPIANSWKPCRPTTCSANSYNSVLGSEPGDIMKRIGSEGDDSCS